MIEKDIILNGIIVGSYKATGNDLEDAKAVQTILKEKGLRKEVTHNDAMFRQGNSFASVAIGLYEKGLKKSPYDGNSICPFVVNATFSIELYLKTIHNAYGNNIKGHSLTAIYKGMPKKGKEIFQKASVDLRGRYQLKEGWDIHTCLESINRAFEVWRYIYENDEIGVEIQSIRYAMNASAEAALRVRESLANITSRSS